MTSEDHLVVLSRSVGGKIKILHHFHEDARSPLRPKASGALWAITGHRASAQTVGIWQDASWKNVHKPTPSFAAMAAAESTAALRALPTNSGEEFEGMSAIAIPPFLAAALMDAESEDAAELCMAAIQAIQHMAVTAM